MAKRVFVKISYDKKTPVSSWIRVFSIKHNRYYAAVSLICFFGLNQFRHSLFSQTTSIIAALKMDEYVPDKMPMKRIDEKW
jgi:hypothetical protein